MSSHLHFPARLYQLIEIEDPSIIQWELSGKSFRIVDSHRFRTETIPKYFQHGKSSSIQRQLNLYGFRCVNRVDEKGVYSHPQFIRGEYDAVRNIRRKRTWAIKGTGRKSTASVADTETKPSNADTCSFNGEDDAHPVADLRDEKIAKQGNNHLLASVDQHAETENETVPPVPSCSSFPCDFSFADLPDFSIDGLDDAFDLAYDDLNLLF